MMILEFLVFDLLIMEKNKKSLGVRLSADDFKYHFNSDFNSFNPKEIIYKDINSKSSECIYKFKNGIEIT